MTNSGAGGSTPTTVNAMVLDRGAQDKATAEAMSSKTRSPAHSTEGGNYHWKDAPTGWGGNVER